MLTANKGEWSEFYAFLKILAERDVALADENLNAQDGSSITFLKIYRAGGDGQALVYDLLPDVVNITDAAGATIKVVGANQISTKLDGIFQEILANKTTTFSILDASSLAAELNCGSIKAPSSDKADIVASIKDRSTGLDAKSGFSVKSLVGGASTLLNAGKTTNFIYEVMGISQENLADINAIAGASKIRDRVGMIKSLGGRLVFLQMNEPIFSMNLRKIDTMMPEFLAQMLCSFYSGAGSSLEVLTDSLASNAELTARFNLSRADYAYKLKQLLVSIALGLVPKTLWDGLMRAHGGYLVVKPQGDLVCYHAIHRDLFLEYLFKNTKFETASSERHDFGKLYAQGGRILMNLNLQIRFK